MNAMILISIAISLLALIYCVLITFDKSTYAGERLAERAVVLVMSWLLMGVLWGFYGLWRLFR